jgi:hypothetical protein
VGSDYLFSFTTGTTMDLFPPQVLGINPPNGASDVNRSTSISVTFNKPVNSSSINNQTFVVASKGVIYPGTYLFSNNNSVATYIPSQLLPDFSEVTVTVTNGVTDYTGNALNQVFSSTFTTQSGYDNFRPWVVAVSPYSGQGGAPQNTRVEITFSERMNPLTINGGSFYLDGTEGRIPATITVSPDGLKATLTPQRLLLTNSNYYITCRNSMTDVAGNASLTNSGSSFTTGLTMNDTTPLALVSMTPDNGTTGAGTNGLVTLKFNKPLAATSINKDTVIVATGGVPVVGTITLDDSNTRIRFRPANLILFSPNTFYEVTVTTGVTDVVGNSLVAPYAGGFTTGAGADTTAPTLVSATLANNATNVPVNTAITLTFSEPINPSTINRWSSVRLEGNSIYGSVPANISISADRRTVTTTPVQPLFSGHRYYLSITNAVEDSSGNAFSSTTRYFTTDTAVGTDLNSLPTGATVSSNPGSLFADGTTTTTVTISNINRNGSLVPNGTKVAITADTLFRQDSAGGAILGGTASSTDPRLKIFTTLGGNVTFTYQSANRPDLTPGASTYAYIQAITVDAAERGINMIGQGSISLFRGSSVTTSVNPRNVLANGSSTSAISIVLVGNDGAAAPAGKRIAVTADPVYRQDSAGGAINGGTPAVDSRFKIFTTISGGIVNLTYTAPGFTAGQSGYAYLQIVEVDDADRITGKIGETYLYLNGSSGYTAPQPVVLTASPVGGQWGVGLNAPVVASFSQSLNQATVNGSNFYVDGPNGRVSGALTLSSGYNGPNTVVTFRPSVALAPYSSYYLYIGTGIQSASGNPLLSTYGGSFSTAGSADGVAPTVTRTNPADSITGVPVNSIIRVEFNESMEPSTINPATFLVTAGGASLQGKIGVTEGIYGKNTVAYFISDQLMPGDTQVTVTLDAGIKDEAGNVLGTSASFTFTTQSGYDNFRPWVVAVSPPNGSVDVPVNTSITVTFSEPINPLSLTGNSFYLDGPGGRIPGNISLINGNTQAVITPNVPLFANSSYYFTVAGVKDIADNTITNSVSAGFRTAYAAGISPLPTGATLFINPDSLYANGKISTTVTINNININGTPAPNGTVIAVTALPAFNQGAAGGVLSGNSIGTSVDGRFLLFQTFGASATLYYTPPDLTSMRPGTTATGIIQVASVDADTRPVSLIGQGNVILFAIGSAGISANPATLAANGTNTSQVTVTVRDRNGNLVPDGTRVGLTAAPIFIQSSAGGTFMYGTTSAVNNQVQIYTTVAGQFAATYQAPISKGSGTAVIQVVTVDIADNPLRLITTTNIALQ